jgi:hypothetical protein
MSIYCVYLTTYSGNKLPPFYIGSSSVMKVENGYGGSVGSLKYKKTWKSERRNNPHLFKTQIISYHETRNEAYDKEEKLQQAVNAPRSEMYINQALVGHGFNTTGHKYTEESRRKMSEAAKKNVAEHKHPLQDSKRHKLRSEKQLKAGTHNFQLNGSASAHASENNRESYKAGKHPSQKIRLCPWCNFSGRGPNMYKWHFANCKHRS